MFNDKEMSIPEVVQCVIPFIGGGSMLGCHVVVICVQAETGRSFSVQ